VTLRRILLMFALLACFTAQAQQGPGRPPPAPEEGCTNCFGFADKSVRAADYSYEPLLVSKPFGENNCGQKFSDAMRTDPSLSAYAPFRELAEGATYRDVVFRGTAEHAVNCMVLLAGVQQRRLQESTRIASKPFLYIWNQLVVKFDPRTGAKLIWVPVRPGAGETINTAYLLRTAQSMLMSLGKSYEDLHASRVQLTVGFKDSWLTLVLYKQQDGTIAPIPVKGMGVSSFGLVPDQ
jgi:hypothetical protein